MSQSVLLTIARASIEEVLQGQNSIDRSELLEQYPILGEPMATQISLHLGIKVRGVHENPKCRTLFWKILFTMQKQPHFKMNRLILLSPQNIFMQQ
jgi:hypothetical protein